MRYQNLKVMLVRASEPHPQRPQGKKEKRRRMVSNVWIVGIHQRMSGGTEDCVATTESS